jgi:hypothetical protein
VTEDLVLVPEVQARRALRDRRIRLRVLAPPSGWIGCGKLRVLRLKAPRDADPSSSAQDDRELEMIAGYESYQP